MGPDGTRVDAAAVVVRAAVGVDEVVAEGTLAVAAVVLVRAAVGVDEVVGDGTLAVAAVVLESSLPVSDASPTPIPAPTSAAIATTTMNFPKPRNSILALGLTTGEYARCVIAPRLVRHRPRARVRPRDVRPSCG
jgi:hypothetical protein